MSLPIDLITNFVEENFRKSMINLTPWALSRVSPFPSCTLTGVESAEQTCTMLSSVVSKRSSKPPFEPDSDPLGRYLVALLIFLRHPMNGLLNHKAHSHGHRHRAQILLHSEGTALSDVEWYIPSLPFLAPLLKYVPVDGELSLKYIPRRARISTGHAYP